MECGHDGWDELEEKVVNVSANEGGHLRTVMIFNDDPCSSSRIQTHIVLI